MNLNGVELPAGEVWRDIPGYEQLYQISDLGRVRRIGAYPHHKFRGALPRLLKGRPTRKGYYLVVLYDGAGQPKAYTIHRLVAAAFIGPIPSGKQVNHKNGNKRDNSLGNLEYVTGLENIHHARTFLNWSWSKNEGQQRITDDDVRHIRVAYAAGETQVALGHRYGVSQTVIWKILHGRARQWVK